MPLKLVVEVDGPLHGTNQDTARDAEMIRRGFEILRFPVQQLDEHFEAVLEAIHNAVQMRLLKSRIVDDEPK